MNIILCAVHSSSTQDACHGMNLVYGPARHKSFAAQWLEHLTGVQKVICSTPVGDSDFFLCPMRARDMLITSFLMDSTVSCDVTERDQLFSRPHFPRLHADKGARELLGTWLEYHVTRRH